MSTTQLSHITAAGAAGDAAVPFRLEVVVIPVGDVDRAKSFYGRLGWRLDADFAGDDGYRVLQLTPPGSNASIIFGNGVTSAEPGSFDGLLLVVDDIDAARNELLARGVEVSGVFHDADGGLGGGFHVGNEGRAAGPDPQRRSYASYASFHDSEGNRLVLQELTERLAGREWESSTANVASLADLLHETAEHHGSYEAVAPPHDWWDWYAAYMRARESGSTADEAHEAAGRYMAETKHVVVSSA